MRVPRCGTSQRMHCALLKLIPQWSSNAGDAVSFENGAYSYLRRTQRLDCPLRTKRFSRIGMCTKWRRVVAERAAALAMAVAERLSGFVHHNGIDNRIVPTHNEHKRRSVYETTDSVRRKELDISSIEPLDMEIYQDTLQSMSNNHTNCDRSMTPTLSTQPGRLRTCVGLAARRPPQRMHI